MSLNSTNSSALQTPQSYHYLLNFYIGLSLAVISAFIMSLSYIFKKLSLNRLMLQGKRAGDGGFGYLKDWMWWLGLTFMATGELINSVAYGFAPASLVTPLGALSVLFTALFSAKILKEHLNLLGKIGCGISLCGSTIIIIHAPKEQLVNSIEELTQRFISYGFIIFLAFVILMVIILLAFFVKKYGKINPLIYILISSSIGSISVMCVKGVGVCIKELIYGKPIWKYWIFYVNISVLVLGLLVQLNYLNKALDLFNTNIISPLIYVCFTTFVIIASSILLEEWNLLVFEDYVGILVGFVIIILGFFLLYSFKDMDVTWKKIKADMISSMYRDSIVTSNNLGRSRSDINFYSSTISKDIGDDDITPFLPRSEANEC